MDNSFTSHPHAQSRHPSQVKLETRANSIYARRGILAEFWAIGCANQVRKLHQSRFVDSFLYFFPPRHLQAAPADGYLQFRNDSAAVYACSRGHVFLPEMERTRNVECNAQTRRWAGRPGTCYPIDYLR